MAVQLRRSSIPSSPESTMTVSQHKAESIGVLLETLGYGMYLILFFKCLSILRGRRMTSKPVSYLLFTTVSLFIFITMHLAIDIDRSMEALETNTADGAELYYDNLGAWKNVFKTGCYVAATVVSDAFIVYRCFIVWDWSSYIIPLPLILFVSDIVFGTLFCVTLREVRLGQSFVTTRLDIQVMAFYSITLILNVICTALIAFKIHKIQKISLFPQLDSELTRVTIMIIESGAIYTACLSILIGTYAAGSPSMFILLNSLLPVIGIVFLAVIIRVGLGVSAGDPESQSSARKAHIRDVLHRASGFHYGVQIVLSQTIHSHHDGMGDGAMDFDIK